MKVFQQQIVSMYITCNLQYYLISSENFPRCKTKVIIRFAFLIYLYAQETAKKMRNMQIKCKKKKSSSISYYSSVQR